MNVADKNYIPKRHTIKKGLIAVSIITATLLLSIYASSDISKYTKDGLRLCFCSVIGAVFPFMILTDLISSYAPIGETPFFRRCFEKLFKINGCGISAFVCGAVCGFPLGVKVARDTYSSGGITKEECERLICFSNNTGPAFVVSGIGYALRGSIRDGVILYAAMILSAITVGILCGVGRIPSKSSYTAETCDFEITRSVKHATANTLNICGYVILFSIVSGFLSKLFKGSRILYTLIPLIEVSNSARMLATSALSSEISLALTAFAVSFSGLSVHLQAKSFLEGTDISMKRYYLMKSAQGIIGVLITVLILRVT